MAGQKIYGQYYTKDETYSKDEADARDMILSVGLVTAPTIVANPDKSLTVGSATVILYTTSTFDEHPEEFLVPGGTFLPAVNSSGIILAEYNGGTPQMRMSYDPGELNQSNNCIVLTFVRETGPVHYLPSGLTGKASQDLQYLRLERTRKFTWESGLILSAPGTRDVPGPGEGAYIRVEAGVMWTPLPSTDLALCAPVKGDDATDWPNGRTDFYYHVGGAWVESHFTPCLVSEYTTPGNTPVKIGADLAATVSALVSALAAGVNPSIAPDGATFTLDGVTNYEFKGVTPTWREVALGADIPEFAVNTTTVLRAAPERLQPVDGQVDAPFTWKTTPVDPMDVLIGADVDESIDNLELVLLALPGTPHDGDQTTICNVKLEFNSDLTPGSHRVDIGVDLAETLANLSAAVIVGGNAIPSIPAGGICAVLIEFWAGATGPQYDNLHYDDGTDIVQVAAGHFVINWVWRFIQTDRNAIGIQLGTADYATLADAEAASIPATLAPHVLGLGYLVGRIIVEKSATTPAVVNNTSETVFSGGAASDHNALSNVNGGTWHISEDAHDAADGAGVLPPSATNKFMTEDVTYTKSEVEDHLAELYGGMTADPVYVIDGAGQVVVGDVTAHLFDNANFDGHPETYVVPGATHVVTNDDVSYIVADYNGGGAGIPAQRVLTSAQLELITESDIIPILTVYRFGVQVSVLTWDTLGKGLANKIHARLVKADSRFKRDVAVAGGFTLSEVATRKVAISEGAAWVGAVRSSQVACVMGDGLMTANLFYHSAPNVWTRSVVTQYNNLNYDDNTGGLKALSAGKYGVVWVYRGLAENKNAIGMVLGQGDYSLAQAQDSQPPASLPINLSNLAILVGRIIVLQGADSATIVQPAFNVALPGASAIAHNDNLNIQGGAPSDYQHLTTAEMGLLPTTNEKGALTGTGTPTALNPYVTDDDSRMTDARPASGGDSDTVDGQHATAFALASHATQHEIGGADHMEPVDMGSMHLHGWPKTVLDAYLVTLTYEPLTRKITLTPTGASFDIYVKGKKFNFVGPVISDAHANATGSYYFYYDDTGALSIGTSFWPLAEVSPVCAVYYDAANTDGIAFFELHTWQRSPSLHARLHMIDGTQVESGFDIGGLVVDSDVAADKRPSFASGIVYDEDIASTLGPKAATNYTILHRTGATGLWQWVKSQANPFRIGGTNYIQYNQWTGATWQLTDLTNGQFVNYYIFVMPTLDSAYHFVAVAGQEVHTTAGSAQLESVSDIDWGTDMPFQEIAPIYKLTFSAATGYLSTGKCVLAADPQLLSGSKASLSGGSTYAIPIEHASSHVDGTDSIPVTNGLQLTGGFLQPLFGFTANTICQGNDTRLTNSRTPSGAANGDLSGTYPNPTVDGIQGVSVPVVTNAGFLRVKTDGSAWEYILFGTTSGTVCDGGDSRLTDSRIPTGAAGGDLTGSTYPNPTVSGLQTKTLPVVVAGGFLKWDAAGTGWEEVVYGSGSNTVCQGNDSRLPTTGQKQALAGTTGVPATGNEYVTTTDARMSNSRAPSGAASGDLSSNYPGPTVSGLQTAVLPVKVNGGFLKWNSGGTAWEEVLYGTALNTVCQGNDSRLSDSRAPTGAASGDLTGTYPGPTLVTTTVSAGSYGSATQSPTFTVDAKGRLTAATNVTISGVTPSAHATSHATGSTDPLTPEAIGASHTRYTQTVSNTTVGASSTAEFNLVNTGVGSVTIPADHLTAGKTLRISASGTVARGTGNVTFRIRLGGLTGTQILATTNRNPGTGNWSIHQIDLTFRTVGAGGTVIANGHMIQVATIAPFGRLTGAVSFPTNAPFAVAVSAQLDASNAGNSVVCTNLTIEEI